MSLEKLTKTKISKLSRQDISLILKEEKLDTNENNLTLTKLRKFLKDQKDIKYPKQNKNCAIWIHILDSINYNNQSPIVIITTQEIKNAKKTSNIDSQFEPRLLCKQDTYEEVPEVFKKDNINILSLTNNSYMLIKGNIYHNIEENNRDIVFISRNEGSVLLNKEEVNSENSMLDNLRYSGVFEDILGEKINFDRVHCGRHRYSGKTFISGNEIDLKGIQYETDACYETDNKILVIEAKKGKQCKSFNKRQLYIPYRSIYDERETKKETKKEIICLFVFEDKSGVINLYQYKWSNPIDMDTIYCTDNYKFKFKK